MNAAAACPGNCRREIDGSRDLAVSGQCDFLHRTFEISRKGDWVIATPLYLPEAEAVPPTLCQSHSAGPHDLMHLASPQLFCSVYKLSMSLTYSLFINIDRLVSGSLQTAPVGVGTSVMRRCCVICRRHGGLGPVTPCCARNDRIATCRGDRLRGVPDDDPVWRASRRRDHEDDGD